MTRGMRLTFLALMGLVVATGADYAVAAGSVQACRDKYRACNQRCAANAPIGGSWLPCIKRTCDPQYDSCIENVTPSQNAPTDPDLPPPPKGTGNQTTPGTSTMEP